MAVCRKILLAVVLFLIPVLSAQVTALETNGEGDVLRDGDGNVYKTVKIGKQVWMAQNLNVKTSDSWCYDDEESNCKKYGRLYSWSAAKKACPAGWHLPSKSEFETLFGTVGGKSKAGKMLKSKTGWNSSGNGTDAYSFAALPAGYRGDNESSYAEGNNAFFWSSTENGGEDAYNLDFSYSDGKAGLAGNDKILGLSVRCVKD